MKTGTILAFAKEHGINKNTLYNRMKKLERENPDIQLLKQEGNTFYLTDIGLTLLERDLELHPIRKRPSAINAHKTLKQNEQQAMIDGLNDAPGPQAQPRSTGASSPFETANNDKLKTLMAENEHLKREIEIQKETIKHLENNLNMVQNINTFLQEQVKMAQAGQDPLLKVIEKLNNTIDISLDKFSQSLMESHTLVMETQKAMSPPPALTEVETLKKTGKSKKKRKKK